MLYDPFAKGWMVMVGEKGGGGGGRRGDRGGWGSVPNRGGFAARMWLGAQNPLYA